MIQIHAIANSVSFAPIPSAVVQKGEDLNTTVKLSSSLFQAIGAARCRVTISGNNNTAPSVVYTVTQDDSFLVQIHTRRLEAGTYNVKLELLLNEIAPSLGQNPSSGFSFKITPLNTVRLYLDDEAAPLGSTIQGIFHAQGLLPVDSDGAYLAIVKLALKERPIGDSFIGVQPTITISLELESGRT
jgi:hypothetical protein